MAIQTTPVPAGLRRGIRTAGTLCATALLLCGACVHESTDDCGPEGEGRVAVRIDWSQTSLPVTADDPSGGGAVHRVSFRFFPLDGSPVFERYLEGNVFEGTIEIPAGSYRLIVMNESIADVNYWENNITFDNVEDYDNMTATVAPLGEAERAATYPTYTPEEGERLVVAPQHLASWSLDELVVTASGAATRAGVEALSSIVMRPLTYNLNLTARMESMSSAQRVVAATRGFADRVYLASARTEQRSGTILSLLGSPVWINTTDGSMSSRLLTFGRVPDEPDGTYTVHLQVLLTNGELYDPEGGLLFDVTRQVEGGIVVDPWDDEEVTLN